MYVPHFGHIEGMATGLLRNDCAPRLFQMAFGGSGGDAKHYLGMANARVAGHQEYYAGGLKLARWASNRLNPFEIDQALAALAADLAVSELIDYRSRRLTLQNWSIDVESWCVLIEVVAPQARWLSDNHYRQYASRLMWARVTSGSIRYAPSPIRDIDAEENLNWHRAPPWTGGVRRPNYAPPLVETLDGLADALARHIDAAVGTQPADVSGALPSYLMDLPTFDALVVPRVTPASVAAEETRGIRLD